MLMKKNGTGSILARAKKIPANKQLTFELKKKHMWSGGRNNDANGVPKNT